MLSAWLPLLSFFPFYAADWALTAVGVADPYYLLHALHNAAVVYLTWPDVVACFSDVHNLDAYGVNIPAVALVVALHLYHIARYRHKFHYDDWLHHGLMIGVAIPAGLLSSSTPLMGMSLFFATGLPGGISYMALWLSRNGLLATMAEKRILREQNVWLRSPGCAAHAALTTAWTLSAVGPWWMKATGLLPAALMLWNGQYFAAQSVAAFAKRQAEALQHQV